MGRACSTRGDIGNAYKIFVGKAEGKSYLEDIVVDGIIY
jgi:hypothetical protein